MIIPGGKEVVLRNGIYSITADVRRNRSDWVNIIKSEFPYTLNKAWDDRGYPYCDGRVYTTFTSAVRAMQKEQGKTIFAAYYDENGMSTMGPEYRSSYTYLPYAVIGATVLVALMICITVLLTA